MKKNQMNLIQPAKYSAVVQGKVSNQTVFLIRDTVPDGAEMADEDYIVIKTTPQEIYEALEIKDEQLLLKAGE